MDQLIRLFRAIMSFMPFARRPMTPVKPMPPPPTTTGGPPVPSGPLSFEAWVGECRSDIKAAFTAQKWQDIINEYLKEIHPEYLRREDIARAVNQNRWTDIAGQWFRENYAWFLNRADVHPALLAGRWSDIFGQYIKESPLPACLTQPPPGIGPTPPPPTPPPHPVTGPLGSAFASFKAVYDNLFVNVSHNPYGAQCVELANAWCDWWHIERFPGNAADFEFDSHPDCDWIANTPTNVPLIGDIVVWGKSDALPFGHVGIFDYGDVNTLTTFDQNWPFNTPAHLQLHNYRGVRGWLRPLVGDNAHGR